MKCSFVFEIGLNLIFAFKPLLSVLTKAWYRQNLCIYFTVSYLKCFHSNIVHNHPFKQIRPLRLWTWFYSVYKIVKKKCFPIRKCAISLSSPTMPNGVALTLKHWDLNSAPNPLLKEDIHRYTGEIKGWNQLKVSCFPKSGFPLQ